MGAPPKDLLGCIRCILQAEKRRGRADAAQCVRRRAGALGGAVSQGQRRRAGRAELRDAWRPQGAPLLVFVPQPGGPAAVSYAQAQLLCLMHRCRCCVICTGAAAVSNRRDPVDAQ